MTAEVDVEAKLLRQIMIRRVVLGVGAITMGVASLGIGATLIAIEFRLLRMGVGGILLGLIFIARGVITLRRGQVRHELTLEVVSEQAPVPVGLIAIATTVVVISILAIAAWPLGAYKWMGTLNSGCRDLITAQELSTIAGVPVSLARVTDSSSDLHCHATFNDASGNTVATVDMGGDLGGGQFQNELDFIARESQREAVAGLGDAAFRAPHGRGEAVLFRHAHAGARVELDKNQFPPQAVDRIIALLTGRMRVLDPYSARWIERYGDR